MADTLLPTRRFTEQDQERFARLSGDWNPMHMDPVAARRTQPGAPVVHGVHLTLWALDRLAGAGMLGQPIASFGALFTKFVYLHTPAEIRVTAADAATLEVAIVAGGVVTTTLSITLGEPAATPAPIAEVPDATTAGQTPNAPELPEMAGQAGWMPPEGDAEAIAAMFPHLTAKLGAERVGAIALTSRLVGMLFPGLHSVYGSLDVTLAPPHERPGLGFRVATANVRTRMLRMTVAGSGITGTVVAFARREAVEQPDIAQIAASVERGEFAGSHALVTGGSRGLGALTAKIIAAGGGKVSVTYALGRAEAERLRQEIDGFAGAGTCAILAYDMMRPVAGQIDAIGTDLTHVYHFASPRIYRQKAALFDAAVFAEFTQAYLTSFHDLCASLQARAGQRLVAFYPSSVFVEPGRPRDMTEYAMAKAAGEILSEEMSLSDTMPLVIARRLPRMLTDQTATLARVATDDAFQVMLPVVRTVQAAPVG